MHAVIGLVSHRSWKSIAIKAVFVLIGFLVYFFYLEVIKHEEIFENICSSNISNYLNKN